MPRLVSLERQLSVPLAEGLRRLEPAQADVLGPVMPELGIKSRQFPEAIPHSRAERRCVRMNFAKKRKVLFCASSPTSSKVLGDSIVCDERIMFVHRGRRGAET